MSRTLLTIDWDFFVPEKPEWDFGHHENGVFLDMAWKTRIHLRNEMRTNCVELDFWNMLRERVEIPRDAPVYVSDSHSLAYIVARKHKCDRVFLVDAHHDCWRLTKDAKQVGADNWMTALFREPSSPLWCPMEAIWLRPEWSMFRMKSAYLDRLERRRVRAVRWRDDWGAVRADVIHICRSGCWTPPWLDHLFIRFVRLYGVTRLNIMQHGTWNPMRARWVQKDYDEAYALEAQMHNAIGEFARMNLARTLTETTP